MSMRGRYRYGISHFLGLPLLILVLCNTAVFSQTFRRFGPKDGFTGGAIVGLLQDSKGFIWTAGKFGVNKYDGYSVKRYSLKPFDTNSVKDLYAFTICEDSAHTIWIGMHVGGLYALDPKTEKLVHYKHNPKDSSTLSSDIIRATYVDSRGRLWVAAGTNINLFDPIKKRFVRFGYPPSDTLHKAFGQQSYKFIVEDKGILYYVIGGIPCRVDLETKQCVPTPLHLGNDILFLYYLQSFPEGCLGIVWNRKEMMFSRVDLQSRSVVEEYAPTYSRSWTVVKKRDEKSYYVGNRDGLFILDTKEKTLQPYPFYRNAAAKDGIYIDALLKDRNRKLWIGTHEGELYIQDETDTLFRNISMPVKDETSDWNRVRKFCRTRNNDLLLGTSTGRVYRWDGATRQAILQYSLRDYTGLPKEAVGINGMIEDRAGNMWHTVITGPGLLKRKGSMKLERVFGEKSDLLKSKLGWYGNGLYEDREGIIWVGAGLVFSINFIRYDPKTQSIKEFRCFEEGGSSAEDDITFFHEDRSNRFWIGSNRGLLSFDKAAETFTRYTYDAKNPESISNNIVMGLFEDRKGRLWLNTYGGGINFFDSATKTFKHFSEKDGLASNVVKCIVEDASGALWVTTARGISYFDPTNKTFVNFDESEGINETNFQPNAGVVFPSGEVFFGGSNGITCFYPEKVKASFTQAPLAITAFSVSGAHRYSELSASEHLELTYDENNFAVEFATLDFKSPEKKRYMYKLDGWDDEWLQSGSRNSASYSNVSPGEYILRIKGTNGQGIWNSDELTVTISITPPYWATWWFRGAMFVLLFGNVGFMVRRRERRRKQHQADLEAAREKERVDLASELHDGPLQDLYATRFMIEPLAARASANANQLEELLGKVRSDLRSITSELQMPRFDLGFAEELRLYIEGFRERYPEMNVILDIEDERIPLDTRVMQNLFRIVRTALINVIKHAQATETAVRFRADGDQVVLSIADNGGGFEVPADLGKFVRSRHYGLFTMYNFADAIGAQCTIDSQIGNGTTVVIRK